MGPAQGVLHLHGSFVQPPEAQRSEVEIPFAVAGRACSTTPGWRPRALHGAHVVVLGPPGVEAALLRPGRVLGWPGARSG